MGSVRTKTVKNNARDIIEKYYTLLTLDFDTNKRVVAEIAEIQSKRLRNMIAGYVTHLMRRIQKGPVQGISLALQEEERERRDNYIPKTSLFDRQVPNLDEVTMKMLKGVGYTPATTRRHQPRK